MRNTTVWCRIENGGETVHVWEGPTAISKLQDLKFIKTPSFVVSNWGRFDEVEVLSENHQTKTINDLKITEEIIDGPDFAQDSTGFEDFQHHINHIKSKINSQEYEKVVISRVLQSDFNRIDLLGVYKNLCELYPNSMVVLLKSPDLGTWIGASPEVLISKKVNEFKIMSLAGTLFNKEEKWSPKERDEQSVTTRHIKEVLKGIEYKISEVHEEQQGTLRHLKQWFTGSVNDEQLESILNKLVPTPAIAGYPVEKGIREIDTLELHKRRLYAGYWGLVDQDNWHLQVNLRVAQLFKNSYNLFAGCGINSGSDPHREWEETGNKMDVVRRSLTTD